ncbi:hypothetical protein HELRODRAFT_159950 [Helobdella robusta]|uniref:Uncharacterized protein n=1 Tax=Helobdella robusta TaxID=6412 RepID=T1EPL3_HELRO|nr:hypothetical protein HELRODRAFT_159950 [Helobdella robusta]ESO05870.1 hypothetical protein HELRODRAFT_159950 [Helobdella robusta]
MADIEKFKGKGRDHSVFESSHSKSGDRHLNHNTTAPPNSEKYSNEIFLNENTAINLKKQLFHDTLLIDALYFYTAIKSGAKIIYLLNADKISNYGEQLNATKKFNIDVSTFLLYQQNNATTTEQQKSFNSSIYYGCYSIQEYDDTNDSHRSPLHCYDGILPALYTPAYFESSRMKSERCDRKMPDISLPENNFVYFNFENVILTSCSFWLLPALRPLLKNSVENGDVIYKCFIQWALWQFDCHISVFWQNYLTCDTADCNFRLKCKKVFEKFHTCKNEWPLAVLYCVLSIFRRLFSSASYASLDNWMNVLREINFNITQFIGRNKCVKHSPMILHPVRQKFDSQQKLTYEIANLKVSEEYYEKICSTYKSPMQDKNKSFSREPSNQNADILLLITFNSPHYETIPLLELVHRATYPYIIYCGHEQLTYRNNSSNYYVSFVTYDQYESQNQGTLNYQCAVKIMKLRMNFEGILAIGDDIFLNINTSNASTSKNWVVASGDQIADLNTMKGCSSKAFCTIPLTWTWWKEYRPEIFRVYDKWGELMKNDLDLEIARNRLMNITGGEVRAIGNTADIYFVSKNFYSVILKLLDIFIGEKVFLEIAIPTALRSISGYDDILTLEGHMEWGNNRNMPWNFLNNESMRGKHFAHPVKLSYVLKNDTNNLNMYCNCIVGPTENQGCRPNPLVSKNNNKNVSKNAITYLFNEFVFLASALASAILTMASIEPDITDTYQWRVLYKLEMKPDSPLNDMS